MQKLEDEPAIEFENFNRAYDGLREDEFNRDYFDAWCRWSNRLPDGRRLHASFAANGLD